MIVMKRDLLRKVVPVMIVVLIFSMMPQVSVPMRADNDHGLVLGMNLGAEVLKKNAGLSGAQTVRYFGKYIDLNDPRNKNERNEWSVIAYDGKDGEGNTLSYINAEGDEENLYDEGTITLLYKGSDWPCAYSFALDASASFKNGVNDYSASFLKSYLDLYNGLYPSEISAVIPRDLKGQDANRPMSETEGSYDSNKIKGADVRDAYLWPLSEAEASKLPDEIRNGNNPWWLRTPGYSDDEVAFVYTSDSETGIDYGGTYSASGVSRHAINLKKDAICFTFATKGGKESGAIGPDSLIEVNSTPDNDWTLSLYDDGRVEGLEGHKNFKITSSEYDKATDSITVKYEGAPVPTHSEMNHLKEYVSAMIQGPDGVIKYYGRICEVDDSSTPDGEASINLSGKLEDGDRILCFGERIFNLVGSPANDTVLMRTELTSGLFEIPAPDPKNRKQAEPKEDRIGSVKCTGINLLSLPSGSLPQMVAGAGALQKKAGLDNAQKLRYLDQTWEVIAYEGRDGNNNILRYNNRNGVSENLYRQGTVTLLYENGNAFGRSRWNDWTQAGTNEYKVSEIRRDIESKIRAWNSDAQTKAILPRVLKGGGGLKYTNGFDANSVRGAAAEDATFWLLSEAEAEKLPQGILKTDSLVPDPEAENPNWWLRTPGPTETDQNYIVNGLVAFVFVHHDSDAVIDYGWISHPGTVMSDEMYSYFKKYFPTLDISKYT
nr:hypothetical protein [Lachnospiraceae bacterium]